MQEIISPQNRRVVETRKLKQKKYRREQRRFLAEGPHLLSAMLGADMVPLELYITAEWRGTDAAGGGLAAAAADRGCEVFVVSERTMAALCDTETPQGVVSVVAMPTLSAPELLRSDIHRAVALNAVSDPGNVGTLLRAAAAFGADLFVVDSSCADMYNPKVVRAAMGAHFLLPLCVVPALSIFIEQFCTRDPLLPGSVSLRAVGAVSDAGISPERIDWSLPTLLVLGNEATGLQPEILAGCDELVCIPTVRVESLNVAMAGSILCYEMTRADRLGASV